MRAVLLLFAAVISVAGCSPSASTSTPSSGTSSTSTTAEPAPSATAESTIPPSGWERCAVKPEEPAVNVVLRAPDGSTLPAVALGKGPIGAVLLHQTDGDGLCGWLPYAEQLARAGVQALALDLCDYGSASCRSGPFTADRVAQVRLAVDAMRTRGVTRIALVGASMGGTIALAAATPAGADAVVDLSGPPEWPPYNAITSMKKTTVPLLFAVSRAADPSIAQALEPAFRAAPAKLKRLVLADSGHGWDLLTDPTTGDLTAAGKAVIDWVRGSARDAP